MATAAARRSAARRLPATITNRVRRSASHRCCCGCCCRCGCGCLSAPWMTPTHAGEQAGERIVARGSGDLGGAAAGRVSGGDAARQGAVPRSADEYFFLPESVRPVSVGRSAETAERQAPSGLLIKPSELAGRTDGRPTGRPRRKGCRVGGQASFITTVAFSWRSPCKAVNCTAQTCSV